jgi:hypothetical protein
LLITLSLLGSVCLASFAGIFLFDPAGVCRQTSTDRVLLGLILAYHFFQKFPPTSGRILPQYVIA